MSKSFGSKVCHVLRVLFYARILFSSSVSHVALCKCGCASHCDNVCDVCLQNLWRPHTFVVVLPSEPQVVQHCGTLR